MDGHLDGQTLDGIFDRTLDGELGTRHFLLLPLLHDAPSCRILICLHHSSRSTTTTTTSSSTSSSLCIEHVALHLQHAADKKGIYRPKPNKGVNYLEGAPPALLE